MRILVPIVFVLFACGSADAQPYEAMLPQGSQISMPPTYHKVSGVAAGDVLNIRAQPGGGAEIIGSFAPETMPVEVIATRENWAYVVSGEQMGWVSRSYLAPLDVATVPGTPVPLQSRCFGTEPFWGFTFTADGKIAFESLNEPEATLPIVASDRFVARPNRFYAVAGNEEQKMTVFLSTGTLCSDGMSDRDYGWSVELLRENSGDRSAYLGCCMRLPDNQ